MIINDTSSIFKDVKLHRDKFLFPNGASLNCMEYYDKVTETYKNVAASGYVPKSYEYPKGCQFELTYKCNQKCIHCYNQSGSENDLKNTSLSIEQWKNIAHQVGQLGVFQSVISGGEPTLLGDDLFEIMDILHSYDIKFVFITNGMLVNRENIQRFRKYSYHWFQVSIDGSRPELHDYMRGVPSWKKAIYAANLVKQAGMPLVIAHAISKKNIDYLEEMIDMAYLLGAQQITTGPFEFMGRAILNQEEIKLSDEEISRAYSIIDTKKAQYDGVMQVLCTSEATFSLRYHFIQPNDVILIRPNGDVKIDCISPFRIGNVFEESLADMWNKTGRYVYQHPRVIDYIMSIRSEADFSTTYPRVNVDPDELLTPFSLQ